MSASPILLKKGPPLEVTLSLHDNMIGEVTLKRKNEPGLIWQIVNEKIPSQLHQEISAWFEAYCTKKIHLPLPPLTLSYSPLFTQKVLEFLRTVPFGSSLSYGELASEIGSPKAARAVGGALGSNPFPLFLPCHRVLAAGSKLGGFSCGLEIKKALLAFESINFKN